MNETPLIIIAVLLTVLVVVFAYNMILETRYRNKIRSQFGHADQDALMTSQTQSVRDGHSLSHEKISNAPPAKLKPSLANKPVHTQLQNDDIDNITLDDDFFNNNRPPKPEQLKKQEEEAYDDDDISLIAPEEYPADEATSETAEKPAPTGSFMNSIRATFNRMLNSISDDDPQDNKTATDNIPATAEEPMEVFEESNLTNVSALLIELDELKTRRLPWFDSRLDYMAYVSLREPQELPAIPRLSTRYRFQIIGCTMDGLFQVAEPIPGVQYQAFVIGLQAINRNGLANQRDLDLFGQQVESFAEKLDGDVLLDNIHSFLTIAKPLDELCARVDQTIAIHLVSRVSILGSELRNSLEKLGFQLLQDGAFGFADTNGEIKYTAVTLDGSQFTSHLLASQPYKGFSMLFDITRVPHGEHNFDEFMNLAVALSQNLHLELVDDQIQQLSTEWLKEVRTFVLSKQSEMLEAHIAPGSELAQRLFS